MFSNLPKDKTSYAYEHKVRTKVIPFQDVPDVMKTYTMCIEQMYRNPFTFPQLPEKMQTREMFNRAISSPYFEFNGFEISGKLFNELHCGISFFKLSNKNPKHKNIIMNVNVLFNPTGCQDVRGLYIMSEIEKNRRLQIGNNLMIIDARYVLIPNDARVYVEPNGNIKVSSIIVGPLVSRL